MNKVIIAILFVLVNTFNSNAQQKKSFLDRLNDGLDKVNGALEKATGGTSNSSSPTKSKSIFSFNNGKIFDKQWTKYTAGGLRGHNSSTPRNHIYSFDIDKNMDYLEVRSESQQILADIKSLNGKTIWLHGHGRTEPIKAGKYFLNVYAERYTNPRYEIEIFAPISNVEFIEATHNVIENVTFGEEGGGGRLSSPRNHIYQFEPERDLWFDIDVESNGVPVEINVFSPNGKLLENCNECTGSAGQVFSIDKAMDKGMYTAIIRTRSPNERGNYKIESVGKFIKPPVQIASSSKLVTGKWDRQRKTDIYTYTVMEGSQEIMLRTTAGESLIRVFDPFGKELVINQYDPTAGNSNLYEPGLKNLVFKCSREGKYRVEVETKNINGGDYELLFFGNFSDVVGNSLKNISSNKEIKKMPDYTQKSVTNSTLNTSNVTNETENSGLVTIKGQVINQANTEKLKLVYNNLMTGENLGETIIDENGAYEVSLPQGNKYSLQVVGDGKFISSSQNIDLIETTKIGNKQYNESQKIYTISDITVLPLEIGSSITLNNIFFATGKSTLLPESFYELNQVSELMKSNPNIKVEIAGHTDNVGGDEANKSLSQDRADAVRFYLLSSGILNSQLQAKGYGKIRPKTSNATQEGKAQNRRVEFTITQK